MGLPLNSILCGDCSDLVRELPPACVDLVLTDPPYIVKYLNRSGRSVANDATDEWLVPAFKQIARVMKPDTFCVSFYGWSMVDRFFSAWRAAGLSPVGHLTFPKRYASSTRMLRYQREGAYLLAKGRPTPPAQPIGDVIPWEYTGNRLHPTQKPASILAPLIRSFCPRTGCGALEAFRDGASKVKRPYPT